MCVVVTLSPKGATATVFQLR